MVLFDNTICLSPLAQALTYFGYVCYHIRHFPLLTKQFLVADLLFSASIEPQLPAPAPLLFSDARQGALATLHSSALTVSLLNLACPTPFLLASLPFASTHNFHFDSAPIPHISSLLLNQPFWPRSADIERCATSNHAHHSHNRVYPFQVTPGLKLRPPPYGYVKYGPGDSLLTAADTQLLMTCDDPEALLIAALTIARALFGMAPLTAQDADDVVFTEEDSAGNPVLGFSTGAVLSTTLTQTGLPVYPEGTEFPENKITVIPFLRSVANSVKHVQGQRTPSFGVLTYNRFPAVAPIVLNSEAQHQQR